MINGWYMAFCEMFVRGLSLQLYLIRDQVARGMVTHSEDIRFNSQMRHSRTWYIIIIIIIVGRSRSIVLLTNLNLLSLFSSNFQWSRIPFVFQFHNLYSLCPTFSTSNFIPRHTESVFFTKPVKPTLEAIDAGRPNHLLRQTVPRIHNTYRVEVWS